MIPRFLIDTNILVDHSRRKVEAVNFLRGVNPPIVVSAITVAELYAGVRDGREREALDHAISLAVVIDIDAQIAEQAGQYLRQFAKSHGTGLGDAFIAATADTDGATLATLNVKHFPMLPPDRVVKPY